VIVGAWMTRNAVKVDRFFIAQGGGLALAYRSAIDRMEGQEILASFLYWTPSPMVRSSLLPRFFGSGIVATLDESHQNRFLGAMERREAMRIKHGWAWGDAALAGEARAEILGMPLKHLLVGMPLAWRGMQVERYVVLNVFLFTAFFGAVITATVRKDLPALVVFGPAVLSCTLHTLATHNIPRYSVVLIPILWLASAYILSRWRPAPRSQSGSSSLETPHTAV
jgi:hypothetical protein